MGAFRVNLCGFGASLLVLGSVSWFWVKFSGFWSLPRGQIHSQGHAGGFGVNSLGFGDVSAVPRGAQGHAGGFGVNFPVFGPSQGVNTCPGPSWLTWSLALWTRCAPAPSGRSSGLTTSSLVSDTPGTCLRTPGIYLETSGTLGSSWDTWGHLGHAWGHLRAHLRIREGTPGDTTETLLGTLGDIWDAPGDIWDTPRACLWGHLGSGTPGGFWGH